MNNNIIKIGIADDHPIVRNGIADLLQTSACGFSVIVQANNGKDLIDKLIVNETPDICIIDINMPVLNGYDTIVALRSLYPDMRFLIFTMYAIIIKMIKNGAHGYLLKGCSLKEIIHALNAIYTHGYYYSEIASENVFNTVKQIKLSDLTEKELDILALLCSELTYEKIAERLRISIHTLHDHAKDISKKLNIKTRTDLALFAMQSGLINVKVL